MNLNTYWCNEHSKLKGLVDKDDKSVIVKLRWGTKAHPKNLVVATPPTIWDFRFNKTSLPHNHGSHAPFSF